VFRLSTIIERGEKMTVQQHKKLLKLLDELQKETKASDKVFKAFLDKVMDLFLDK
jgi:hypothetical protein